MLVAGGGVVTRPEASQARVQVQESLCACHKLPCQQLSPHPPTAGPGPGCGLFPTTQLAPWGQDIIPSLVNANLPERTALRLRLGGCGVLFSRTSGKELLFGGFL